MNRLTFAAVSERAAQTAQVATGVAGLSYGLGWLLMVRFYGALGADPEEAGVTFTWLAARAFLIGLVVLSVLLAAKALRDRAVLARPISLVFSLRTEVRSLVEVRLRTGARHVLSAAAGVLVGFLVTALVVGPLRLGEDLAADVRDGRAVDLAVLGLPLIRTTSVRLSGVDPASPAPASACVLRLGGAGGTSLYVAQGRLLRVSDQNVNVSGPC